MKSYHQLLYLLPSAIILFSCQQNEKKGPDRPAIIPPPNTSLHEITLMDSLGKMSIYLPEEYDTSFFWTDYSDCVASYRMKYRFQPRSLAVDLESGFFHDYRPCDSINRFTMFHSYVVDNNFGSDSVQANIAHHYNLQTIKEFQYGLSAIVTDTIELIGDRLFSIYYINIKYPFEEASRNIVKSNCTLRGNPISFEFIEYPANAYKQKNIFFENCTQILRTCRFEKSK